MEWETLKLTWGHLGTAGGDMVPQSCQMPGWPCRVCEVTHCLSLGSPLVSL